MKNTALVLMLAMLAAGFAGRAQAQTRVFVSAQGSDGNPCTATAPCRTFQHAHDTVAAGGEVDVLDPAGYGTLTISKAISIQGHGFSGISVPAGQNGIAVNVTSSDRVYLSGLLIDGGGNAGAGGIQYASGGLLSIVNCVVRDAPNGALRFFQNTNSSSYLSVADSYFTDSGTGIWIVPQNAVAVAGVSLTRVILSNNSNAGLFVNGTNGAAINVAVTDSAATDNGSYGFYISAPTADSNLALTRAVASGNGAGVQSDGAHAKLSLAASTLTHNTTGYATSNSGIIQSYSNNYITLNGSNIGTLNIVGKQ